ncbi:MAG: flagellin [Defluviitaleaceae bacterium]|nr:flagellin [Defluviitaleaceae bacterium]MCL2274877.1 flagellin [Defluviitaleaceae bacterium]
MKVKTNTKSLNTQGHLKRVTKGKARASQRLASGFRINSAADDAAGLAISEKMRAQIRGLDQAQRNSQDAISLIQTAEGGIASINNMLIRMRELVVQAANDTNIYDSANTGQSDRFQIQREINELVNEVDHLSQRLEFNTRRLISGNYARNSVLGLAAIAPFVLPGISSPPVWWNARPPLGTTTNGNQSMAAPGPGGVGQTITAPHSSLQHFYTRNLDGLQDHLNSFAATRGFGNFANWLQNFGPAGGVDGASFYDFGGAAYGFRAAVEYMYSQVLTTTRVVQVGNSFVVQFTPQLRPAYSGANAQEFLAFWVALDRWITHVQTHDASCSHMNFGEYWARHIGPAARQWEFEPDPPPPVPEYPPPSTDSEGGRLWFQLGANLGQGIFMYIEAMDAVTLGLRDNDGNALINVLQESGINISLLLNILDKALAHAVSERAHLGAMQNRLEYTSQFLTIAGENLSASNSRIRDADMALEMMSFTQGNVLQQAALSMLAQANQSLNAVMQLLS